MKTFPWPLLAFERCQQQKVPVVQDPRGSYRLTITAVSSGSYNLAILRTDNDAVKNLSDTITQGQSKKLLIDVETMKLVPEAEVSEPIWPWEHILITVIIGAVLLSLYVFIRRRSGPTILEVREGPRILFVIVSTNL